MPGPLRLLLLAALAWLIYAALLYATQRSLVFAGAGWPGPPAPAGVARVDLVAGEARSEALWLPAAVTGPAPAIVFAHGNAELVDHAVAEFAYWQRVGYHVLLVEYPGYGRSPGEPSQAAIDALFVAAWDHLAATPGVDAARIVGFGRSLGSGPIAALATRRPLAAVVLQSPYASTAMFAHARGLPGFLVRDRWDNVAALAAWGGPVYASQGRHDEVIPPVHGERLAALPNVRFGWQDCGHNDCPLRESTYLDGVAAFLRELGVHGNTPAARRDDRAPTAAPARIAD
jgi:pimeloyl-ACP methyl ester carboxylesterase